MTRVFGSRVFVGIGFTRGIVLGVCGHTAGIPFLPFCPRESFVLRGVCVTYPRTLTKRVTWSRASSGSRAFRYRRKLRVTDRHQRGILRGFSQPLFCTGRARPSAHLLSIIMMVITVLLSG